MGGTAFGGGMETRGEDPLIGPVEQSAVCRRGGFVVVLTGDVEGEVEEGLGAGFEEGGESSMGWCQYFIVGLRLLPGSFCP